MKKVLIITYYWPPAGGIGVHRFLKIAKYLPEFGWQPIILTPENGSYPYMDNSLESQIPKNIKVYKTDTFEPFAFYNLLRGKKGKQVEVAVIGWNSKKTFYQKFSEFIRANFFIPDARVGWNKYAIKKAIEIINDEKPDVIVTTGPPHSTHLIGLSLKKIFGIPWIADMRDPWTRIFYNFQLPRTQITIKKDEAFEREVFKKADLITVIGPGMKKHFEHLSSKIEVIYNGFDESDLDNNPVSKLEKFTIRFVGNMKANDNIPIFWSTFKHWFDANPDLTNNLRIIFTGRVDEKAWDEIKKNNLDKLIELEGFVPHHEAVKKMQSCHLLLFSVPITPDGELFITGKLFEYIGANVPILGIGPIGGDADVILQKAGRDPIIDYEDNTGMLQTLNREYRLWKSSHEVRFLDKSKTYFFTRKNQTLLFEKLLSQLTPKWDIK